MMRQAPWLLIILLFGFAGGASAHAYIASADPPVDGNVPVGATLATLRFTEGVENRHTDADVIDLNGDSWKDGDITFDPNDRTLIYIPLKPLEDGIYAVTWRVLSVDTHNTRGSYIFSVGNATLRTQSGAAHDHSAHDPESIRKEGMTRGLFYAGMFAGVGIPVFLFAFDRGRDFPRHVLRAGGALALMGGVAGALGLRLFLERTDLDLAMALETVAGRTLMWRALLLALAGMTLVFAAHFAQRPRRATALGAILLGAGAMTANVMGSHAASVIDGRPLALALDIVHLIAGAIWIGGVVGFILVAKDRSALETGEAISRFSPAAVGSIVLLVVTGAGMAIWHMPHVSHLWLDSYGRLVLFKSALILPLLGMGWYNSRRLMPKLREGGGSPRIFRRVVIAEAFVMVAIVLAAGVLAATPPPESEAESAGPQIFELDETTRTTHVLFSIHPNPPTVGVSSFTVALHPLTAEPISNNTVVMIKFAGPGEPEPHVGIQMERVGPFDFHVEGGYLTRAGEWTVYVDMQRPNEFAQLRFTVPVKAPPTGKDRGEST